MGPAQLWYSQIIAACAGEVNSLLARRAYNASMIAQSILDRVFRQLKVGGLLVHYPDGKTEKYGPDEPYLEIRFKNAHAMRALVRNSAMGFGEGYMNGDIEVIGEITQPARLLNENLRAFAPLMRLPSLRETNRKAKQRSQIARHYDLGNDFYKLWLDESMTYSCAYFHAPTDLLEQAQDQKVDHILRKLQLKKGQSLLDIGCGWGKLLITAAQRYGVSGYGITLSEEQFKLAQERVAAAGLSERITIELINYQDLAARDLVFDRIVSVGMYEHVGRGNHAAYFAAVAKLLAADGLSVLHTITARGDHDADPWTAKYIFPGGFIPSVSATVKVMEGHEFELQDYENLRFHYAMTLDEWLRRFDAHRAEVVDRYGEEFYRMWRLYLGSSASGFRYGGLQLSQFVFTKGPQTGGPLTRAHLYA